MKTGVIIKSLTEQEAFNALEQACNKLVKDSRWFPYQSKINSIRLPLIQLKKARKLL